MTKRKEITEPQIDSEISIKVIDAEVAKNKKLYKGLPDTLRRLTPPEHAMELWFDFSKLWHPIGLFDAVGKLIISKQSLTMEISNQPSSKDEIKPKAFSATALSAKGKSVIHNIEQIDRGYQDIEIRLNNIGADIRRIG